MSSLKMYKTQIELKGSAEANSEIITPEESIDEYIMLSLRSYGIEVSDLEMRFGNEWLDRNKDYLQVIKENNFIIEKRGWIKLTKRGYAICDEIIAKFA